jgi:hypothetical protein
METKQTAVEWLVNEILTKVDKYDDEGNIDGMEYWNSFIGATDLSEYVNKAKEMEKQHIIEARVTAPLLNTGNKDEYIIEAEQYYNETFKK